MSAPDYPVLSEPVPGVRRLRAPNPSAMTGRGTNSYLVGRADLVAIDPGPADPVHLDRLLELAEGRLTYVLVTHEHADHAPGAPELARRAGAVLLAYGRRNLIEPDGELADGDRVQVEGFTLEAIHTPGHASDHLCLLLEDEEGETPGRVLFSGDHVMGASTVVISPPDGDMAAYLSSIERLQSLDPPLAAILPGHGELIEDPAAVLAEYHAHRLGREREVLGALSTTPASPRDLVRTIYPDLAEVLHGAAARQLWAHLRKLGDEGRARSTDASDPEATWVLSSSG